MSTLLTYLPGAWIDPNNSELIALYRLRYRMALEEEKYDAAMIFLHKILELDPMHDRLCYKLRVEGIDAATMAHIHLGAAGASGGVATKLDTPADGSSANCTQIAPELTQGLMKNASGYYVNVHNEAFPAGAVRGQIK